MSSVSPPKKKRVLKMVSELLRASGSIFSMLKVTLLIHWFFEDCLIHLDIQIGGKKINSFDMQDCNFFQSHWGYSTILMTIYGVKDNLNSHAKVLHVPTKYTNLRSIPLAATKQCQALLLPFQT